MGMHEDFWTRDKDGSTWPAKCRVKMGQLVDLIGWPFFSKWIF